MRNKFALKEYCFLVEGAKRGAIYDLNSGDVYSVSEESKKILSLCEKGFTLDLISKKTKHEKGEIQNHLVKLVEIGAGRFIEKDEEIKKIDLSFSSPKLNFIWLELTSNCNLKCLHCYAECDPSQKGNKYLSLNNGRKAISEAADLGCQKIQLIGGEPMLYGKKIFELVKLSRESGYSLIEIFTNATLLSEDDVKKMSDFDVSVAISVYSAQAKIHDSITQKDGSFAKTMKSINLLRKHSVKTRYSSVVMKQNQHCVQETAKMFQDLGIKNTINCFDVVRCSGRGINSKLLPDKYQSWFYKKAPVFAKIGKEVFIKRLNGHNCWQDRLCIKPNGDIIPCIMAREEVFGNIKNESLLNITEKNHCKTLQGLSKDKVSVCKDCEYRYACSDCRPIAKEMGNSLYAKEKTCLYDPYTGIWSNL